MTLANLTYGYQTAPWDSPLSWGVQAFIEYNGIVLNDRHQADRIRVTNISGLDDADVSDSREVIPGDDGENAYDSFYRGRTMILSGRIEAGSLPNLKRLERDLKAAFANLSESPMKFRWFDVSDSFDDPATMGNYTPFIGNSSMLVPTDGLLHVNTTSQVCVLRTGDNNLWGDKQVGIRVVSGWTGTTDSSLVQLILAYQDANDYLAAQVSATTISIYAVSGGVPYLLNSTPWNPPVIGTSVWFRGRTEGDLTTAEIWLSPPVDDTVPDYSVNTYLQGTDSDALGDQVMTLCGFGTFTSTTNWAIDDFLIESLAPGDVIFNVKKMPNGMSIKDSQDSQTKFNRTFQITCRASRSFASCATQSRSPAFVPSSIITPALGLTWPLKWPMTFSKSVSGGGNAPPASANTFITVNNRGTVPVRPKIFIYGAVTGFTLLNLQNNMEITWSGVLADGDYLVFDCLRRTLVDSKGYNMLGAFASSSGKWMQLEPGQNDIYFIGTNYSANTEMLVFWNHGLA